MASNRGRRTTGIIFTLLATFAFLAFLFLLFADANDVDVPGSDELKTVAIIAAIAFAATAILLFVLILLGRTINEEQQVEQSKTFFVPAENKVSSAPDARKRVRVQPSAAAAPGKPESDVLDSWTLDVVGQRSANPLEFYYPLGIKEGVYVIDRIPVAPGHNLAMKTLIYGPKKDREAIHFESHKTSDAYESVEAREETWEEREPVQVVAAIPADAEEDGWSDQWVEEEVISSSQVVTVRERSRSKFLEESQVQREPARKPRKRIEAVGKTPAKAEPLAAAATTAPKAKAVKRRWYDFHGGVIDVLDVEGIGEVYAGRLRDAGILDTDRLAYHTVDELVAVTKAPAKTVTGWKHMVELMRVKGIGPQFSELLVRSGVEGMDGLKKMDAQRIVDLLNAYVDSVDVTITGRMPGVGAVENWKDQAATMRRTNRAIPEDWL